MRSTYQAVGYTYFNYVGYYSCWVSGRWKSKQDPDLALRSKLKCDLDVLLKIFLDFFINIIVAISEEIKTIIPRLTIYNNQSQI